VIAVLSVVYAKTKDIELSVKIANAAAAIVVGKPGTATITVEEIEKANY
jgi:bifunctional ADP-heptose synthase (sugar kinase/adenylyltransferase)